MLHLCELKVGKLPTNGYVYAIAQLSHDESINGTLFCFVPSGSNAVTSVNCTVYGIGDRVETVSVEQRIILEVAGNTVYNVNTGTTTNRAAGSLSFNFSSNRDNILTIRPGLAPFASSTFLPRMLVFLFDSSALKLSGAYMVRRTRMVEG